MKKIAQGAEAVLYLKSNRIIKSRVPKSYRLPEIDNELRKSRTTREANVLKKIPIAAPVLFSVDKEKMEIEMEHIKGERLSEVLEKKDYRTICKKIGHMVAEMHRKEIIHGDLTTSNMILRDCKKDCKKKIGLIGPNKPALEDEKSQEHSDHELFFIDFGLSFFSTKSEDKAVDLHLLHQALESRHHTISETCFKEVLAGYDNKEVIRRLESVEKRGRNKLKDKYA
ncbi:Kae1-associated serine/threonine protein kinase [Candidatus Woesearchaeota archaeon]|nr:Kae1-associated serine/threonine protein kinase [Candidatus Woesearchaeota archaeon]